MIYRRLAVVRRGRIFVLCHIAVDLFCKFRIRLHCMICLLDYIVTRGANRDKRLILSRGSAQRPHGGKLGGNFIAGGDINAAAALPIFKFAQRHAELFGAKACIPVQLLCLSAQRATGKITDIHIHTHPFAILRRSDHFFRMENLIEFFRGQKAQRNACLFERDVFLECFFRRFCGIFISDIRIECRNKHQ